MSELVHKLFARLGAPGGARRRPETTVKGRVALLGARFAAPWAALAAQPWPARIGLVLGFLVARLALLPVLALGLLMAAIFLQGRLIPAREAAEAEATRQVARLEREARQQAVARQAQADEAAASPSASPSASPADTRQRLLARFPSEAQLNAELGRLLALAGEQGLQVPSGDYRLQPSRDGLFDRYVLNLPVKGAYLTVRRYVAAARREFPDLAVDDISLRREAIGQAEVEAQLRFVLFARRAAP